MEEAAYETRFARAEIAFQSDALASDQDLGELTGNSLGLFGGVGMKLADHDLIVCSQPAG